MIPPLVANGHRVIATDLIRMGRSDKPIDQRYHHYERHVANFEAFLDQLGLRDITLVCQDWGSVFTLRILAEQPDRFRRALATNAALGGWLPHPFYIPEPVTRNEAAPEIARALAAYFASPFPVSFQAWVNYTLAAAAFRPEQMVAMMCAAGGRPLHPGQPGRGAGRDHEPLHRGQPGRVNATPAPYRLYGQEVSYFTAKVRCALRDKGLWFEEDHADFQEITRRTGMAFIPVVVTPPDETWQDSSDILDHLEARHPDPPLLPATPRQRIACLLVELYIDEFGTLPAMAYRWGTEARRNESVAHFSALFGLMGRKSAGAMIRRTATLGVDDATRASIEAHTEDLLARLSAHFEAHDYLLSGRMSYADCALMALVYAHLFNDYESRGLLLRTALPVVSWIERCNTPSTSRQNEWLADHGPTPTFRDLLQVIGSDGLPHILASAQLAGAWAAEQQASAEVPRSIGRAAAVVRGTRIERAALPYTLYMLQRVTDAIGALSDTQRKSVREALAGSGWEPIFDAAPRRRVRKQGFQLALAGESDTGRG